MKKENKRMAQERRKAEREKQERKAKFEKFMPITILIAVLLVVIVAAVVIIRNSGSSTENTEGFTVTDDNAVTLNTDPETVAENGDTVNIDYVGSIDGVEFDGGNTHGTGADLTLGTGTYIDNFEDQIVGHKVGDTFDVTVTFPDDYGAADLAGKEAVFVTTLNGVYKE